jgi:predicted component of type VI protein secretion system
MYDYNIGGQERKSEVNEGITDIPSNRTLIVSELTDDPPLAPNIVPDLKNIRDVFDNFKPEKEVEFDTAQGTQATEKLKFNTLGDFGKQGVIRQSEFLNEMQHEHDDLEKIIKQLRSNKILKTMLENPEGKAAYIAAIQSMMAELGEE